MLKKKITYTDYDGNTLSEDFFFHLNKAELTMLEMSEVGGLEEKMKRIIKARDGAAIMDVVRDLIKRSYGEKSPDGRRFVKSEAMFEAFEQSEAYSELFMELCTSADAMSDFVKGILPSDLAKATEQAQLPE